MALASEPQSLSRSISAGKRPTVSVSGLSSLAQMKMPPLLKQYQPQSATAVPAEVTSPSGSIGNVDASRTTRQSVASKLSPVTLALSRPSPPPLPAATLPAVSSARHPSQQQLRKRSHNETEATSVAVDLDSAVQVAPTRNGRSESKANRRVVDDNNDHSDDVGAAHATDSKRRKSESVPMTPTATVSIEDVDMSSSSTTAMKAAAPAAAALRTAPKRASKSPLISSLPSSAASPAASPASSCASSSLSIEHRSSARVAAHASKSVAAAAKTGPMVFAVSGAGADVKAALATVVEALGTGSSARYVLLNNLC